MERTKESGLKAVAKRPKLFAPLLKGGYNIHQLKKIGECSGGLIRSLIWAGIAEIQEDKTIKFVKGIKQSDLPSLDKSEIKPKTKAKEKPAPKPSKVIKKPLKPAKKEVSKPKAKKVEKGVVLKGNKEVKESKEVDSGKK